MEPVNPILPKMSRIEANIQSPVLTSTSRPVATMPIMTNTERKRFLPRITSETVPSTGEMTAAMSSEMLSVRLQ